LISLIENEFVKIFKKKGIYITFAIIFALIILINILFSYASNLNPTYYGFYEDYSYEQERLKELNPENINDIGEYLSIRTTLDLSELRKKYEEGSWQMDIVDRTMYGYMYEVNRYTYGFEKDPTLLIEAKETYNEMLSRIDSGDWRSFAEEDKLRLEGELLGLEEQKAATEDKYTLAGIEDQIFSTKLEIEVLEIRLSKDIVYGMDYMNEALDNYRYNTINIREYENLENKIYEDEKSYQGSIENLEKAKYILETEEDIYGFDLRQILLDVFAQYNLFIIIIVVMIAGSIVSDEFSKGTVKLWLVRPHSRTKLLLAKFITSMIMVLVAMLIVVIAQIIIGGVIFGFDSLKVPAVVYDFNAGELITMNLAKYVLIQAAAFLPFFILIATIAFAISTIMTNTALAITISILGYISNDIINSLVYQFEIKFMKYFISMNWNLSEYLFGRLPYAEYMSFGFSAIMCVVYFAILIIPSFIMFKKKNIKNI